MSIDILLASSSPYRRAILTNLGLNVRAVSPNINETPLPDEPPHELVKRLAIIKSQAVDADTSYVIGCDQVAVLDGQTLGKPHTMAKACQQLTSFSGKTITFYTGLALRHDEQIRVCVETFNVSFRELSQATISHYLKKERPLDCAGSFKAEGLGILLFKALEGRDPNALIGLPVIALNELFELYGINLLTCT